MIALVVVLALAVGQNAALCHVWCAAQASVVSDCPHHEDTTVATSVAGDDGCGQVTLVGPFVREEPGGSTGGSHSALAMLVSVAPIARRMTDAQVLTSASRGTFDHRPRTTALRV
jgi:hypothetical protein